MNYSFNNTLSSSPKQFKCVVVGDGAVGKTSMLMRFVRGDFLKEYTPTYFDSFTVSMAVGDEWAEIFLTIIDTAGQETYDRLRTLTYFDTDVFIVCFSVASPDSLLNVRSRWIPELKEFKPNVPVILVGTQTDLRDSPGLDSLPSATLSPSSIQRQAATLISYKEGKRIAKKVQARTYAECSALTGDGLNEIFYHAVQAAAFPKIKHRLWLRVKQIFTSN